MSVLAKVYVEALAEGIVLGPETEAAREYGKYSKEYESVRRAQIVASIVKESALKTYGSDYYLLGSMV